MKLVKALLLILILAVPSIAQAAPFFQAETGMIASDGSQAPLYGFRCGALSSTRELSVGFWTGRGMSSSQLLSGGLDLNLLSAEIYHVFPAAYGMSAKLGGGIGYAIPNLNSGPHETADNGHAWIFGAGIKRAISDKLDLEGTVKGFFFTTDTHVTTYSSHVEGLFADGVPLNQGVEVLDIEHHDDVVNFNSAIFTLSLRW